WAFELTRLRVSSSATHAMVARNFPSFPHTNHPTSPGLGSAKTFRPREVRPLRARLSAVAWSMFTHAVQVPGRADISWAGAGPDSPTTARVSIRPPIKLLENRCIFSFSVFVIAFQQAEL